MAINTSKTLEKTSAVLAKKCEETAKNMDKLMREAGMTGAKMEKVTIPLIPGTKDDVVFAGVNGAGFYFLRGKTATMPEPIAEILENTGILNQ